ncbi:hypothetical protein JRO89_XS13G0040800 [Xanthoceras sorbifolium]|uniref:DNA-directed RNA polymerase n=1 Tax=Xanthoceras sorbifolium TaxID=99658 RepID=A0ABQ8H6G2_9ROSI|nr:hypothetical protein JRO89_XS13G0040800 [Xanthoceras sorbifolium]
MLPLHFNEVLIKLRFLEIKKVDILWKDIPKASKSRDGSFGELYLRVFMSRDRGRTNLWSVLMNDCLQIMDMIDWTRSHPDNINSFCLAYGIDAGLLCFLNDLESAVSDTGKTILPEHLLLLANSMSYTGEFVGLNAKGIAKQRGNASVSSPFMQACFSNPGACFIKAAKEGVVDNLQGSIDALAWGKVPSVGTGGHFDLIYSGEGHKLAKPVDVYNLLGSTVPSKQHFKVDLCNAQDLKSDKCGAQFAYTFGGSATKRLNKFQISRELLRRVLTLNDIQNLDRKLRNILYKYPIDQTLSESDKHTLMMALYFHPRRAEKIGAGVQEIKSTGYSAFSQKDSPLACYTLNNIYFFPAKPFAANFLVITKDSFVSDRISVTSHPEYQNTRCFSLERTDGTIEDFSYRKCVLGALEIIAPGRINWYQSKCLRYGSAEGKGFKSKSLHGSLLVGSKDMVSEMSSLSKAVHFSSEAAYCAEEEGLHKLRGSDLDSLLFPSKFIS